MKKHLLNLIGFTLLCGAVAQASQEQLAQSIRDAQIETARTADQLKSTLSALNALTRQKEGDLRPTYTNFTAEVAKTGAAAAWTRTRVDWMAGDGQQYFQAWQQTINEISNASLKKTAQRRLDSVKMSYQKVETQLKKANDKFTPFLSDLTDIQKALASDITPGGVRALRSTVDTANWNYKFLNTAVNSALNEMRKMEKMLSPEVKK